MSDPRIREVRPGSTITVEAFGFLGYGNPTGLRLIDLLVSPPGNVVVGPVTTGFTEGSTGNWAYELAIPSSLPSGEYATEWQFGGVWYRDEDIIKVNPGSTAPGPFISRGDLTDYLGRDVTADEGALIALDSACDMCRTLSEQTLNEVTADNITLDGSGTDALVLPELPVTNVTSVTVDGGTVTDYVLKDDGVLIRKPDTTSVADWNCLPLLVWPSGRQNVEVTYDHGYTDVPRDIRMVALSIASRLIVQGPALQESNGNASIRYGVNATDLTNGEKAILRKYRR